MIFLSLDRNEPASCDGLHGLDRIMAIEIDRIDIETTILIAQFYSHFQPRFRTKIGEPGLKLKLYGRLKGFVPPIMNNTYWDFVFHACAPKKYCDNGRSKYFHYRSSNQAARHPPPLFRWCTTKSASPKDFV